MQTENPSREITETRGPRRWGVDWGGLVARLSLVAATWRTMWLPMAFGANRRHSQKDSCHGEADAIREAQAPGQHRDDSSDQEQHRSSFEK
jgi:hypothetical protein